MTTNAGASEYCPRPRSGFGSAKRDVTYVEALETAWFTPEFRNPS